MIFFKKPVGAALYSKKLQLYLRTYDGSKLADVQADPDDTAISLMAMSKDSPRIKTKLRDKKIQYLFSY